MVARNPSLLPGTSVRRAREATGARTVGLGLSLVLHLGVLLLAGDWLDARRMHSEAPFVVSLVAPVSAVTERERPRDEEAPPPAARAAAGRVLPEPAAPPPPTEAGRGTPEAPTLEEPTPPAELLEARAQPVLGESTAAETAAPVAARRDVAGEIAHRLMAQLDTLASLPQGASAGEQQASGPQPAAARTGADAGIEGPLGERGLLYLEDPAYPLAARQEGIEAEMRFRIWVSPAGHVVRARALQKGGHPLFETLAREALGQWRFEPLPHGQERTEWGEVRIRWGLPEAGVAPVGEES